MPLNSNQVRFAMVANLHAYQIFLTAQYVCHQDSTNRGKSMLYLLGVIFNFKNQRNLHHLWVGEILK